MVVGGGGRKGEASARMPAPVSNTASWKHAALPLGAVVLLLLSAVVTTTDATRSLKYEGEDLNKTEDVQSTNSRSSVICNGIDHPEFCTPIAKKSKKGSVERLAQLTVKATMSRANHASKMAAKLQSKMPENGKRNMAYELLDVCRTNFDSMHDDLKNAMATLKGKNSDPIRNYLSALSTYLETCIDAYDETPDVKSPFRKAISPMKDLVDNLFWMADKIKA